MSQYDVTPGWIMDALHLAMILIGTGFLALLISIAPNGSIALFNAVIARPVYLFLLRARGEYDPAGVHRAH